MISDESFRLVTLPELDEYKYCSWFSREAYLFSANKYFIPERYLKKALDQAKYYEDKLQELIDGFDFERVHSVMKAINWTWTNIGVPNENDMIAMVHSLYNGIRDRVLNHEYCYCSSGGFKLIFNPNEDNELRLVFELETCSVYDN
jgi:hypothetical protein